MRRHWRPGPFSCLALSVAIILILLSAKDGFSPTDFHGLTRIQKIKYRKDLLAWVKTEDAVGRSTRVNKEIPHGTAETKGQAEITSFWGAEKTSKKGNVDHKENVKHNNELQIAVASPPIKTAALGTSKVDEMGTDDVCRLLNGSDSTQYKEAESSYTTPSCNSNGSLNICTVMNPEAAIPNVRCRGDVCQFNISIGAMHAQTGEIHWTRVDSAQTLETKIISVITENWSNIRNFGYCLIHCQGYASVINSNISNYNQLLILPPRIKEKKYQNNLDGVSINIIHIDSISRRHFYRSLPRTVEILERLKSAVHMLDFSHLQTIKARTYESLKLLFTGKLPDNIDFLSNANDRDEVPANASIAFDFLLAPLKKAGFNTLYLDDLCWYSGWGLARHLGIRGSGAPVDDWRRFQEALTRMHIDDIGPSMASCDILKSNGVTHPFHGPDAVCYNGHFQHSYLLDYLESFQHAMRIQRTPFFTFFMTNVAHEPRGQRVKTLDSSLADYLRNMPSDSNTITIITSDHGNSYSPYVQKSLQGRIEMFNPPLFVLVPNRTAISKPDTWTKALEENQEKLVTFFDVHHFLRDLVKPKTVKVMPERRRKQSMKHTLSKPVRQRLHDFPETVHERLPFGLQGSLEKRRTCNDIPMLVDTICICEGHFTRVTIQPRYFLLTSFALGQINNVINRQRLKSDRLKASSQSTGCLPIILNSINAVWVRHQRDTNTARIDITVTADGMNDPQASPPLEVLKLTVQWGIGSAGGMTLVSATRLSPYGHYRECADAGVDVRFCLCSSRSVPSGPSSGRELLQDNRVKSLAGSGQVRLPIPLNQKNNVSYLLQADTDGNSARVRSSQGIGLVKKSFDRSNKCLHVVAKRSSMGAAFWCRNLCLQRKEIRFSLNVTNMDVSEKMPLVKVIEPQEMWFIAVCIQSRPNLDFWWKYTLRVTDP